MAEAEQRPQWHLINQNQGRTSMGRIGCLCCSVVLKALRESMCGLGVPCGIDWGDTEGQWHRCTSGECVCFYRLAEALWWEHRWGSKSTSVNKADLWILLLSNTSKSHQTSVHQHHSSGPSSDKWAGAIHWPGCPPSTRSCHWTPGWPIGTRFRAMWDIWLTLCVEQRARKHSKGNKQRQRQMCTTLAWVAKPTGQSPGHRYQKGSYIILRSSSPGTEIHAGPVPCWRCPVWMHWPYQATERDFKVFKESTPNYGGPGNIRLWCQLFLKVCWAIHSTVFWIPSSQLELCSQSNDCTFQGN